MFHAKNLTKLPDLTVPYMSTFSVTVKISGDRKRNLDPTEITWTNWPPKQARVATENIMTQAAGLSGHHSNGLFVNKEIFSKFALSFQVISLAMFLSKCYLLDIGFV